jgi:eukaryotic-like serine/threonine-protein kinase
MSDDKDKKAGESEEERTVFVPGGAPAGSPAPEPPSGSEPVDEPEHPGRTLSDPEPSPFAPDTPEPPAGPAAPAPSDPEPSPFAVDAPGPSTGQAAPPRPEAEESRTVFAPAPDAAQPRTEPDVPALPEAEDAKTVFAPAPAPGLPPSAAPSPPAAEASGGTAGVTAAIVPRQAARGIEIGDVLNHIFEVKRFIGRGGMGEVFEGCNVNTEERVAIKVMLPAMAADEKIVGLFRKEARTLTKLQHEALVSYRVLAQEPQIGVLYIVTEYIEGVDLAEMLGKVERTPDELAGLLKRLASGLAHAHRLGAIHRDLSPDNVLLPGGDVHEATIIDFGIAKDLNAGSATIVGDGFAGKLNYVAPEQLGDYGREIGSWTDVYSLGLVMLAVAQGKPVDMSGSLVDAIDKRRKGPDLSAVPRNLRFLLEDMLKPDPKERIRTMDEVLARLGASPGTMPPTPTPPPPPATGPERVTVAPPSSSSKVALVVGIIVAALLAAAAAYYFLGGLDWGDDGGDNKVVPDNRVVPAGDPPAQARNAINSVLPSVPCTWLEISGIQSGNDGLRIAMRGVAGETRAAEQEIGQALSRASVRNTRLDFGDVAPILPAGCAALDTYRQVRATSATHVSVAQPRFEMMMQPAGMPYAGAQAANAVISFNLAGLDSDFAILGIEPSGQISRLVPDRATFETARDQSVDGRPVTDDGNGRYRLNVDLDHIGWSGIILITGGAPFDADLVAPPVGSRGPSWQRDFLAAAAERNWRVEMVWFESVNRVPGDTARPVALPPRPPTEPPLPIDAGEGQGDKPTE